MFRTHSLASEAHTHLGLVGLRTARVSEAEMDAAIAESFPASDPPAWNPGLARPIPPRIAEESPRDTRHAPNPETAIADGWAVIDVSQPRRTNRTAGEVLVSIGAMLGVVLLAPLAVLAIGTPVALAVRGVMELILWTLSMVQR